MEKNGLSAMKAKGYVVQFFPQKKDCFSTHQSAIEKLQQFFRGSYLDGNWQAMPSITTFLTL